MALKKLELIGACAAFVPGVSSVSSFVKAFYYVYKVVNKEHQLKINQKVYDVAKNKLDLRAEKKECYDTLMNTSFFEVIPFVNVIAAIYSLVVLSKLSNLREVNKTDQSKQDYLCSKYHAQTTAYSKDFFQAIKVVDSFDPEQHGVIGKQFLLKYDILKVKKVIISGCQKICAKANGDQIFLKSEISKNIQATRNLIKKIDGDIEFEEINTSSLDKCWEELAYSIFFLANKKSQPQKPYILT